MAKVFTTILKIIPELKLGLRHGILVGIIYEFIKFFPIILIKYIVDALVEGHSSTTKLVYFIGGIFVAYLAMNTIDHVAKKAQYTWLLEYETSILKKAKKKLLELHLGYHEALNTGAQVSKITKGSHRLMELLWFTFEEFIPTIIQLLITFILLMYEQWLLGLLFLVSVPLTLGITLYAAKRVQVYRRKYHQHYDEAVGELGESLLNISTVKDYVQEERQFQKFNHYLMEYAKNARERWRVSLGILIWRDLLITLGRVITLALASYMVIKGTLSAGSLVLVYSLTERAFLATYRIGRLYNYLEDAMESINRLAGLLEEKPLVQNRQGAKAVAHLQGEVEFHTVTFSYGSNPPVMKNFQLHIKPHQVVALVGKSGSGKTTVAKLLLRHYDVTKGAILVDGKDIRDYTLQSYKKHLAVVSQSMEIFNRTILENILFADPTATKAQAMAAAKKAHAHEFIMHFPKGYETIVGEKGVRLSGGQKQRISIARALLKNPEIYIFDEATSSLDTESERYIQQSIFSIAGKKTTFIIAHRLSTIRKADLIVVMDDGKIIEQGSYQALLKKKGAFWKMITLQSMVELRE